jgi:site-specific recombinase XerD
MAQSLNALKRQFLEYIEIEKGRSLKTVENYDHYLTRFLDYIKTDDPTEIKDEPVRQFRLWLNRQPAGNDKAGQNTLSKKTQNYYLIAIRAFLKYLARQEIKTLPSERIELAKTSERSLDLITSAELTRLLDAPKGTDLKGLRDKAILELLFSTGLRVSELCSLTSDLDLHADSLSIRGKGGKVRVVFISDEAKKTIRAYLSARKDMEEALFVKVGNEINGSTKKVEKIKTGDDDKEKKKVRKSKEDERMKQTGALTRRSIERIVKHYATKAGISKKVTPHTMRHLFATDLLSNGADIRSVQALLGHSSIVTTQIYTHVTDKHLHDIHKKFHNKK